MAQGDEDAPADSPCDKSPASTMSTEEVRDEDSGEDEVATAGATPNNGGGRSKFRVEVGTSDQATGDFCSEVAQMVCRSYGYQRLSAGEVHQRLSMGDAGDRANRVLHLAWRAEEGGEETLVGCCSSTVQTPWCPRGCGHWGLLVVAVEAQGTGVASALVRAAERRLSLAGLGQVQIEYEYTCGEPQSERLYAWYEGSLGFDGGGSPTSSRGRTEFRRCRKRLVRIAPTDEAPAAKSGRDGGGACVPAGGGASGAAPMTRPCWARVVRIFRAMLA